MKWVVIFFILMFTSVLYSQNFPRKDIDLLLNKELKVKKNYSTYGFYKDAYLCRRFHEDIDDSILVGKIFSLISYSPSSLSRIYQREYLLTIKNDEFGILYYEYDSESERSFDFEVIGGLDLPDDFYCKDTKQEIDKFTGEITYESVESEGIKFIKYKNGNSSQLYMSIKFIGQSTTETGNGAILILLENGKILEFQNAPIRVIIDYYYNAMFKEYWPDHKWLAFISLTDADIKLLKKHKITDIRLSISDRTIDYGESIIEYLKCIIEK